MEKSRIPSGLVAVLVITALLTGCPAALTPTPSPTPTKPLTIAPTPTPTPTPTSTPTPTPSSTTGSLKVICNISSAKVYLGVDSVGTTGVSGTNTIGGILPGTYTVKVTFPGWSDNSKQVSIVTDKTTILYIYLPIGSGNSAPSRNEIITPDSAALYGSLKVICNISSANVYIGDESGGTTGTQGTNTIDGILPGTYTVKVTMPGWKDWTGQVSINSGQTTTINPVLVVK